MTEVPVGHHSEDCAYWWTGDQWVPAWSSDRRWWFDGATWVRPPRPKVLNRRDVVAALVWGVATAAALFPAADLSAHPNTAHVSSAWALSAIGIGAVLGLPVTGWIASRQPRPADRVLLAIAYVWSLCMAVYFVAMLATNDPNADTAAGAGLVFIGIPSLGTIAVLQGLGFAIRLTTSRVNQRRAPTQAK